MKESAQIFQYNKEDVNYTKDIEVQHLDEFEQDKNIWINFHGLNQKDLLKKSFEKFGIHRLTQNDILRLKERPKIEEFENYLFVTLKSIATKQNRLISEQISFILSNDGLLSYQEKVGDLFLEIRNRLKNDTGIVRSKKVDYLLYLLIDAVLNGYQDALLHLQESIDDIQVSVKKNFNEEAYLKIEEFREELKFLKKSLNPLRDQLVKLSNAANPFIAEENMPYFNDLKDQIYYLFDEIETEKSDLDSMSNLYFALLSQRSNEIMQFLTIVAALFIPLTFIAGVYGMNFDNMPELHSKYGYPIVWAVMILLSIVLIIYFKRKKWF